MRRATNFKVCKIFSRMPLHVERSNFFADLVQEEAAAEENFIFVVTCQANVTCFDIARDFCKLCRFSISGSIVLYELERLVRLARILL